MQKSYPPCGVSLLSIGLDKDLLMSHNDFLLVSHFLTEGRSRFTLSA